MKKVSFYIAIDSYIARKGIVSILNNISGSELTLDTDNPDVFKNQVKEQEPDFIIISVSLFNKTRQLYSELSGLPEKTILLKTHKDELPGVTTRAVFHMQDPKEDIIMQLESIINPLLSRKKESIISILSAREITILKHVATGLTNKQIAEKLFLSLHTVTTHRKNIGNKLGIKSVSGLTVYAIVNNIISIEDISNTSA